MGVSDDQINSIVDRVVEKLKPALGGTAPVADCAQRESSGEIVPPASTEPKLVPRPAVMSRSGQSSARAIPTNPATGNSTAVSTTSKTQSTLPKKPSTNSAKLRSKLASG